MADATEPDDISDIAKAALSIIANAPEGRIATDTKIQKLSFLFGKTLGDKTLDHDFDFVAYDFGPYSENLTTALERLVRLGLVKAYAKERTRLYEITKEGDELYHHIAKMRVEFAELSNYLVENLGHLTPEELTSVIYELYPDSASESFIRHIVKECRRSDSILVPFESMKAGQSKVLRSRCGVPVRVTVSGQTIRIMEVEGE